MQSLRSHILNMFLSQTFFKERNITGTVENFYAPPISHSLLRLPRANTIMNLVFISFMHDFYFSYMPMNP